MKPYSEEFRQRIVNVYFEEQKSIRQIVQQFKVSKSFVQKILKQYRETGTVASKAHKGGKSPKLNSKQIDLISELVEQNQEATLQQLCNILERKTRIKVSISTMSRIVRRLK